MRGWETTERLRDSGHYASRQCALFDTAVVEASEAGARWLGVLYWEAIARFTRGAVRGRWSSEEGTLRLAGALVLLRFGPAELAFDQRCVSCTYAIRGGVLALRAGGSVALAQRDLGNGFELSVTVDGYVPRLGSSLYGRSQAPFHSAVSRRYFQRLEQRASAR